MSIRRKDGEKTKWEIKQLTSKLSKRNQWETTHVFEASWIAPLYCTITTLSCPQKSLLIFTFHRYMGKHLPLLSFMTNSL